MSRPPDPPLIPVKRISPSRYFGFKQCALREVWRSSGAAALLPKGPGAWLGQAIHSLLEQVGKHEISDPNHIPAAWDALLAQLQKTMATSPSALGLIPLERSAFHFEIRKRQAQRLAATMVSSRAPERSGTRAASELWLQTKDGKVGGKVDRIIIRKDGATIIDFKSGSVTDVQGDNPTEIKPEYKDQLMLYAALYCSTNGSPPTELQVVGLDGETHAITFTMADCDALLADAIARLDAVNEIISSPDSDGLKKQKLASPSAATCLYCEFRPGCDPYLELTRDPGWQSIEPRPIDVIGELVAIRTLGNGRLWAKVRTSDGVQTSIRGLDPKHHVELMHSPRSVAFFTLSRDSGQNNFVANQMTTVFTS